MDFDHYTHPGRCYLHKTQNAQKGQQGKNRLENKSNRSKKLVHISDILNSALSKYRPANDTRMTGIWDVWDKAVGQAIAMNTKPDAFKKGTLSVLVSSSSWIHHLKFLEKDMILNINRELDQAMVKKLKFKIGNIHN